MSLRSLQYVALSVAVSMFLASIVAFTSANLHTASANSATAAATADPFDEQRALFKYDSSKPLDNVKEFKVEQRGDVTIRSITYPSLMLADDANGPVTAYLVLPPGKG